MPLDWPDQARFIEVLRNLRGASKSKLDELVTLAHKDARKYYKHSVAILVKQIQVKKPRQRVPVLYAINSLCVGGDDDEVRKLFASRFSRDILKCVEAALKCPPQHLAGLRRCLAKWRRRKAFEQQVVAAALALADRYEGWDPSLIDGSGDKDTDKDTDNDVDDYAPSSDENSDDENADTDGVDRSDENAKMDGGEGGPDGDDDDSEQTHAVPAKVPEVKKVRAWGAAPKRPEPEKPAGVDSAPVGGGTKATEPEADAWNPPPPSEAIAMNPASNPPPPRGPRDAPGPSNAPPVRVASNSSPPRQRSPPESNTDARGRGGGGKGAGAKKGGGRERDRSRDRDRRRSRDSGNKREPKVEFDKWGDPIRRQGSRERSADDGYRGIDEPRRRSPPVATKPASPRKVRSPAKARGASPPKVRSPVRARSPDAERRGGSKKQRKQKQPLPPSPEKKRTPPR